MQMLDPTVMPLVGQNLIEASAGTGKTYTITGLYLRCLLGLTVPEQENTPLNVEQILVVTFTDAATAEIRDRVRKRIVEARDVLLGKDSKDDLILRVLKDVKDKKQAFTLLDAAAKSMDEAAIYTIHGFCQKMLKQHAFESNMGFNQTFVLDSADLIDQAVKDYWRSFIYPLDTDTTQTILEHVPNPQSLNSKVSKLLSKGNITITPSYDLDDVLATKAQYQQQAQAFKRALLASDFFTALDNSGLAKNKAPGRVANIAALIDYCQSDNWYFEFGSAKHSFNLWSEETLSDSQYYKKGQAPMSHPLLKSFSEMFALHQKLQEGLPLAIVQQAAKQVAVLLEKQKRKQGVLTPDDLLTQLHAALTAEQGELLAEKIATLFPMAMIDEFQDTDPIQYGIFQSIYGAREATTLTMIGDPKQAIYGFRGADIFTYIYAKKQVQDTHQFTLATNFRSAKGVVDAVNSIFKQNENSFIYNKDIPFEAVAANGKKPGEGFELSNEPAAPLCFSVLKDASEVTSKGVAHPALAELYASKTATLLNQAQQGAATIAGLPVAAGDICFLVRDRNEAALIKRALTNKGIDSVYLARESVFQQPVSQALMQFLMVLHGPYDEALLRGVLASDLFGLNYQQIFALQNETDSLHAAQNNVAHKTWQEYLLQFSQLKALWYKKGVMAMLEQLLVENDLPLLWQQKGHHVERWLTDYRHLAELLQHKQIELEGTQRVLRWYEKQYTESLSDTAQVRLESDENLVKIITMHASKGLEYPIVYLPFASGYREASEAIYHKDDTLVYDLSKSDDAMQLAEKERLAEDIRLLYVALTRAVHHCDVGMYNLAEGRSKKPGITQTALGYVLFAPDLMTSAEQWHARLDALCTSDANLQVAYFDINALPSESYTPVQQAQTIDCAVKAVSANIERDWRATSFSQLTYHQDHDDRPLGAIDENHLLDLPLAESQETLDAYTFPKGAKAGSCLHEIFELIDFSEPETPQAPNLTLEEAVKQTLDKFGFEEKWQAPVKHWVSACLACKLDNNLALKDITPAQRLVEMEFNLPLAPLDQVTLNNIVSNITQHPSNLKFDNVKGLLKGFIDLIFEHQGKYYILDYKSNYLGDTPNDYASDNLVQAMNAHQYHLQYMIYTVALHRLLKARLPNYQPEHHLGGVYYVFLRAMGDGEGVFFKQLSLSELEQLDALFLQGAA